MRLLHKKYDFYFEFKENEQDLLIVEYPTLFYEMMEELFGAAECSEGEFVLSENDKPVKMKDRLICIANPCEINFNERRLISGLYETIQKEIAFSDIWQEYNQMMADLERYAIRLLQRSEFDLAYSEQTDIQGLLKFLNVKFVQDQDTLIEKLIDYIYACNRILKIQCFVFVNLFSFLTEYEMEKLFEFANYQKVNVLLLESRQPGNINSFSKVVLIDRDQCEILLKN